MSLQKAGRGCLQEEGPCEPRGSSPHPWTVQQAGAAKAWAYVKNKDAHFIIRVPETQTSKSKSIYLTILQGIIPDWQARLVSAVSIYNP